MRGISKHEYLFEIRERYLKSTKEQKQNILDVFCRVCPYNRKYAISLSACSAYCSASTIGQSGEIGIEV